MLPYSREQQFLDEPSNVFDSPPTAGDVFFELGVMLATSLGFVVAARLLLVALGTA